MSGSFSSNQTYQMEKPPEEPIRWEEYSCLIKSEWNDLLNRQPTPLENEIQNFLEKHPCMIPGAHNMFGGESGHPPILHAVISQPVMPTYGGYIPDFMWLSTNSDCVEPVFIEIESPKKKWFTKAGTFTQNFQQALDQIDNWKAYLNEPTNEMKFKEFYGLDQYPYNQRAFTPSFVLIYGRREEATLNPHNNKKRHYKGGEKVVTMTFDRLSPKYENHQYVCLKIILENQSPFFKAISVPATLEWCPILASIRSMYLDLDEAINMNEHISPKRKEFLIRRLNYWNEWSKHPDRVISTGDCE